MNPLLRQNTVQLQGQLDQFKKTLRGDPEAIVKSLISSGKMTQAQFQQLSQQANALSKIIK